MTATPQSGPGATNHGDASWFPVLASVTLYPGIGQWMQKRRFAAVGYFTVFTIMAAIFTWIFYRYLQEVIPLIRAALLGELDDPTGIPSLETILKPFAAVLFIYAGNCVDVMIGRLKLNGTMPKA